MQATAPIALLRALAFIRSLRAGRVFIHRRRDVSDDDEDFLRSLLAITFATPRILSSSVARASS